MAMQTQSDLARLLGPDFSDIRPLGAEGGLSRLFRAHKNSLNMDVVIKRMQIDPAARDEVQREARVMTSLRHQFLPRILHLFEDGGCCYTVMELIPGCTLRQYVRQNGALDQRLTLYWMRQLCQAAAYMHDHKPPIIHSDLKPENIMITPDGNICVIDFNASLELRGQDAQAVGATVGYAAPEQYNVPLQNYGDPRTLAPDMQQMYRMSQLAQGMGKVTPRTDLYAIGAVAYFMLTGYDPANWDQPLVPLTQYSIQLNDALRQVIERCMAKNPADRFASAAETLRALDSLPRMDARYRAWRRKCQATALAVGAGLLLSAFCVCWGVLAKGQETGDAYNQLIAAAQQSAEDQDYTAQEDQLLQAIQLDRERPEAYANLGALLYRQGEYQQAVDLLGERDPNETGGLSQSEAAGALGEIQYVLGACYYQLEEYGKAVESYQLAAYFRPEEAAYQRDLAVAAARAGQLTQAQEAVDAMAALDPQPGDTELVSGEIAYASGQYEQALEQLEQAVRLSADAGVISRASLEAAACCQQLGDGWLDREIQVLESAAGRLDAADNGMQLQRLSEAWIRKAGQPGADSRSCYETALGHLQELMDRGQPVFAVRQNTALVLEYLDRFSEAEQILLALQADYPADYRPLMRLGLLYADMGDYSRMRQMYDQAQTLYAASGETDGEMARLAQLVSQLGGAA